jgi:HK97 family phage major capsid protein
MELKEQFEALQKELKQYLDKAAEQQKLSGTITEELKTKIEALQKQVDAIDIKLAERHAAAAPEKTLYDTLAEDENLKRFMRDRSGSHVIHLNAKQMREIMERKTTVTETAVGVQTTGVLTIERIPGITPEARQELTIRDLLVSRPTNQLVVDFVKVLAPPALGSPQTEASDKAENAVTFQAVSAQVRTLATWIPASKQVLDDMTELMGYLQVALPYYVNKMEELEILSGDNTGVHLNGLITQAPSYNTALTPAAAGWNRIDIIGRAIQQITAAKELAPTFFVVHPTDWWSIRLTKDSYGRYILGNPQEPAGLPASAGMVAMPPKVFGLTPVVTTNIASGTFLVGSGNPIATEIRDRMEMTVEIATQHSDYFVKNLIAIRAEKRMCLVTKRPASFITGTFTTSP